MRMPKKMTDAALKDAFKIIKEGTLNEIRRLFAEGFDPKFNHDFILSLAASRGYLPLVEFLVETHKLNINCWEDSPLRHAAGEGHLEVVEYLVRKGAYISSEDYKALHWAVWRGRYKVVQFILSLGVDTKALTSGDLTMVCCAGHLDMVKLLVEELNVKANSNHLRLARMEKHEEVAEYLAGQTGQKG